MQTGDKLVTFNLYGFFDGGCIKAAGVVPLLATLTPDDKNGYTAGINATVTPLIISLAAQKSASLADTFAAVEPSCDVWSFDGLHPNYDCMVAIARTWYAHVPIAGQVEECR